MLGGQKLADPTVPSPITFSLDCDFLEFRGKKNGLLI